MEEQPTGQDTEILDLDTRTITYGPSMTSPRQAFHLVLVPPGRLFALGGFTYSGDTFLDSVEELVAGAWVEVAALEASKADFGAVAVPEGLGCA